MYQLSVKHRLFALCLSSLLALTGCVSGSSGSGSGDEPETLVTPTVPAVPPKISSPSLGSGDSQGGNEPAPEPENDTVTDSDREAEKEADPETETGVQTAPISPAPPQPVSSGRVVGYSPVAGFSSASTFPYFSEMERMAEIYYIAPQGAGVADGSSPANAFPFANLQTLMRGLDRSAKLLFEPGEYAFSGTVDLRSPSPDHLLILEGEEGAVLKGNFSFATLHGTTTGFRLKSGNVVIRGLSFRNLGVCVRADKNARIDQVVIENIDAQAVHSCVLVDRDVSQEVSRWLVRNSTIQGYYRVGVRLAGPQSHDFVVDNVLIDGAHDFGRDYCYKGGVQLYKGVHNVQVRNSTIRNNIGQCDGYRQGEAIEADHKNGTPTNLVFDNLLVANSGDAEFDLKADQVRMSNIQTLGGNLTRFAFKVWSYDYLCENCSAYGSRAAYVNLNRARMHFVNATFQNYQPVHVCDLRHGATALDASKVSFDGAKIYIEKDAWLSDCGEGVLSKVIRLPMGFSEAP